MNDVAEMAFDMSAVNRRVEVAQEQIRRMEGAVTSQRALSVPSVSGAQVQLDPLLFADIEINSLRQQVVEKDMELLRGRLEQLREQQRVLWGAVQQVAGMSEINSVTLVDREKRIIEVG